MIGQNLTEWSKKVKYIKPKKFFEVFQLISDELYEITFEKKDRELLYDRQLFVRDATEWYEYLSNEKFDKDNIFHTDIRTVAELIGQIVIFGRIIRERMADEFNLPKGEVPLFHRQIDEKGDEEDLWDISSGKIIKKWSKKKKGRKKLEEMSRI